MSGAVNNPIIQSQVLNWLLVLQQNGVVFDLMCSIPILYLIKNWKKETELISYYQNLLQGKIYLVPIIKSSGRYTLLSTAIKVIFLIFYKIIIHPRKRLIIQTRTRFNRFALSLFKRIFSTTKVIYDMRGAVGAEYLNSLNVNSISELSDRKHNREYKRLLHDEMKMVELSDSTFCVSHNLKQYVLENSPFIPADELYVVPGAADSDLFYYDKQLGSEHREALQISGKTSFVYCGSLKHFWHKSELIFQYASVMLNKNPDMIFICITRQVEYGRQLQNKYGIKNQNFICKYCESPGEINAIYNAADFGILFRDDWETNRVSSPTKLSEYLLAGLPVLLSTNIGDFSDIIEEQGLGAVVSNDITELMTISLSGFYKDIDRYKIHLYAKEHYSKQAVIQTALEAYSRFQEM